MPVHRWVALRSQLPGGGKLLTVHHHAGDHERLGSIRRNELAKSCGALGIEQENCVALDEPWVLLLQLFCGGGNRCAADRRGDHFSAELHAAN